MLDPLEAPFIGLPVHLAAMASTLAAADPQLQPELEHGLVGAGTKEEQAGTGLEAVATGGRRVEEEREASSETEAGWRLSAQAGMDAPAVAG